MAVKSAGAAAVYQLKVSLLGTKPPIWRRLLVPSSMTLAELHHVLQVAMGWADCHLHEFSMGERRFGAPSPEEGFSGMAAENERGVRLSGVLSPVESRLRYTYDFGDGWEHGIVLEKQLPVDAGVAYPVCTGGKGACPPEDCGGISGYYELVDALKDPEHERHEEMVDWVGEFDPEGFSVERVNQVLAGMRRRRK